MNFEELKIKKEILQVINELGFDAPTDIQREIIPYIIDGYDVLGKSATGTGKTLAFAGGLLSKIKFDGNIKSLILAPTRELAIQVEKEVKILSKYMNIKTLCVYGSSSIENQIKEIKRKPDIIVGTPGRVLDLLNRKILNLSKIDFLVLDEADEMLNMGFIEDLKLIFKQTKNDKQVLLFSATMPKSVKNLSAEFLNPKYKEVNIISEGKTALHIKQAYYLTNEKTRTESMCRVIDKINPKKCIIFSKTKKGADELLEKLSTKGYNVDIMHGDITQAARINTLERFRNGIFNYLIATDVAARGIHVDDIDLIINYNLPQDNETYVHRIGRTGRAGNSGIAITFVTPKEEFIIKQLEKITNTSIEKRNIPAKEDIIKLRKEDIISNFSNTSFKTNAFLEYVDNLNIDDLKKITLNLLDKELFNYLGSDFRIDLTINSLTKKKKNRKTDDNSIRVFLTIGKLDNIDKKTLLSQLEKTSGLPNGCMHSTEILTKFTFLTVEKKHYDKFIKKCNGIKINGKKVKIEQAKK